MTDFKLSASLTGHEDDVKAIVFPASNTVVTASRDQTVRLWQTTTTPPKFDDMISSHGEGFINAVTYLPPSANYPDGLIVSGGRDSIIDVRQPGKGAEDHAEAVLIGHASNVCVLDIDQKGEFIISGSWDGSAKIWPVGKWECDSTLEGHEGSVWAVLAYDRETIITGAADKLIKVFHRSGKEIRTIKGSQDVVRALCRVPQGHPSGADFASAGNDGIIRLWTIGGKQIAELHGHESFIYSLASLSTGELVSAGEDRTARVWRGTECVQTITHPAISVWSVAVCEESGDIVTGASDRIARVFTRNPEHLADASVISMFEESVKASSIPQEQVSQQINKETLPGPEFLQQKSGTKEGQVQMIKEADGSVTAHMWSTSQGAWASVGTVVEAAASSGKKTEHKGKEYDFVFDVDIEDGKPPLKLPFNLSQNPYDAASKFITDNELPSSYLEQVANFIVTNTQGHKLGIQSQSSGPAPAGADPWGSESRYRPGGDVNANSLPPAPKILPQKQYLDITQASVMQMQKKIETVNSKLVAEGQKGVSLNPTEISILGSLCTHLGQKSSIGSVAGGLDLALRVITSWPYGERLAGLDLVRLLATESKTATFVDTRHQNVVDLLTASVLEKEPPTENNIMMAIRAFVNFFTTSEGRTLVYEQFDKIQDFTATALNKGTTNRNLLVASTTLYINYAVLLAEKADDVSFERATSILEVLSGILSKESDSEVIYRAMVATGTLLGLSEEIRTAAKAIYDVEKNVRTAVAKASDPRIKNVALEIRVLLK